MNLPYEERYKDISEVCAIRGRYIIGIPQIELLSEIIPARTVIYLHGNESGAIGDCNLPWPPYFEAKDDYTKWIDGRKRPDLIIYDDLSEAEEEILENAGFNPLNDPSPDFGG